MVGKGFALHFQLIAMHIPQLQGRYYALKVHT